MSSAPVRSKKTRLERPITERKQEQDESNAIVGAGVAEPERLGWGQGRRWVLKEAVPSEQSAHFPSQRSAAIPDGRAAQHPQPEQWQGARGCHPAEAERNELRERKSVTKVDRSEPACRRHVRVPQGQSGPGRSLRRPGQKWTAIGWAARS